MGHGFPNWITVFLMGHGFPNESIFFSLEGPGYVDAGHGFLAHGFPGPWTLDPVLAIGIAIF